MITVSTTRADAECSIADVQFRPVCITNDAEETANALYSIRKSRDKLTLRSEVLRRCVRTSLLDVDRELLIFGRCNESGIWDAWATPELIGLTN